MTKEKTNTIIGNLTYLSILAIAPVTIISTSLLNILNDYFNLSTMQTFEKIFTLSNFLNLNKTTNIFINLICINLLSTGIFSLLSEFEILYHFKFNKKLQKSLYSLALSIVLMVEIIGIILTSFFISKIIFFQKIQFALNLTSIFIFILTFYKFSTFQKTKKLLSGAIVSSLFLTIFLSFFYYVIENFSSIKNYYGLLAPIIILLLLIYYSCFIIYLGCVINISFRKENEYKT